MGEARDEDWRGAHGHHLRLTDTIFIVSIIFIDGLCGFRSVMGSLTYLISVTFCAL